MHGRYAGMQIGSIYMLTCEIEYVGVNVGKHCMCCACVMQLDCTY